MVFQQLLNYLQSIPALLLIKQIGNRRSLVIIFRLVVLLVFLLSFDSCMTWYDKRQGYNSAIEHQDWRSASEWLNKEGNKRSRNRLLFLLEQGFVQRQSGYLRASNRSWLEADQLMEDFRKKQGSEMLALISNPMMKPYQAEDAEFVLVHYYLALNFLELKEFESALVECRRIQLRMQELEDKYKGKNRYSCDAFVLMLSGMIYEAMGNSNDAFIAYRNAYNCYQEVAKKQFDTEAPQSLKEDILRTARKNGFLDELDRYEKEWGIQWNPDTLRSAEIIILVNHGLGPVKAENSLSFFMVQGAGGVVNFTDESGTLNFPFMMPSSSEEKSALGRVQSLRIAFPKYVTRDKRYDQLELTMGGQVFPLAVVENVNAIAFQSLEDRKARELGNSLMRLAVKKGIEMALREQDQTLGAIVGLAGAISEKADTRHWQTLPYEVLMKRIPVQAGSHQLILNWKGVQSKADTFSVSIKPGETLFLSPTGWQK